MLCWQSKSEVAGNIDYFFKVIKFFGLLFTTYPALIYFFNIFVDHT